MKVAVLYVYPMVQMRTYYPAAIKFAETYRQFDAGYAHQLHVICNGREPMGNETQVFARVSCDFLPYDNSGWDIGAYQRYADLSREDLIVCLGAHAHFHRPGWLAKMVEAVCLHGPGLYGCTAYEGDIIHVRTTLFWCPPDLLRSYPAYVGTSRGSRYEFEHGHTSFTRHCLKAGFPCVMTTFDGSYEYGQWDGHQPDHNRILVRDQHIHE